MESMNHVSEPPTVAQEQADRLAQRDKIAALFRLHPLEDIEANVLKACIGDNYQQRISDCRTELGMYLQNQRRTVQDAAGVVHRLAGAYRWYPDGKPLGRDAGTLAPASWPTKHGKPFQQELRLR